MIKRFFMSGRSGFYFSVIEPGEVSGGSKVEILSRDPNRVTVADIGRLYRGQARNVGLLQRKTNVGVLPESWKAELLLRGRIDGVAVSGFDDSDRKNTTEPIKTPLILTSALLKFQMARSPLGERLSRYTEREPKDGDRRERRCTRQEIIFAPVFDPRSALYSGIEPHRG